MRMPLSAEMPLIRRLRYAFLPRDSFWRALFYATQKAY